MIQTPFLIQLLIAIIASLTGGYLIRYFSELTRVSKERKREREYLNQILSLGNDDLVFIYEPKESSNEATQIIPSTHTEDFLAINAIVGLLAEVGFKGKSYSIPTEKFKNHRSYYEGKNLIVVGSGYRNSIAKDIMEELKNKNLSFYYPIIVNEEIDDKKVKSTKISDTIGHLSAGSQVQSQLDEYLKKSDKRDESLGEMPFDDIAVFTKVKNPWDLSSKTYVYVIAGIWGIGTWGAAELLRDWARDVYKKLKPANKRGSFSTVLDVHYKSYQIEKAEIIQNYFLPIEE